MRPELAGLIMLLAAPAGADPAFERVSTDVTHAYTGGWEHFVGGGMAVFDCNGDTRPEIFAAGGASPSSLLRNRSGETVAFATDTPPELSLAGVTGAYPLDIDSDGTLDLVVLRVGENLLLQGQGDCRFSPFDDTFGFSSAPRWTASFSATWEPGQDLPTLAFGNYVDRSNPNGPFEACDVNMLYRPQADRYGAPLPLEPGHCALSMLFSDWGRNGRADLRISNDRHYYVRNGQEQMWAMDAQPRLYTEADGWARQRLWGMGIASRDLDFDGLPEVYLTSMGDQILQSLTSGTEQPTYANAHYDTGVTAHRPFMGDDGRPSTGWHPVFGDVNNDGLDDLFVAKGNVDQMPGNAFADPNNLLVQGADGRFAETALVAGVATTERARGAALADFDLDGRLDLAVLNRRAPIEIYQNITKDAGDWITLDVRQSGTNGRAVGSWIELEANGRIHAREITVGGGHAGGTSTPEHFGLGNAASVRVRVIWPDGATSAWQQLDTNTHWKLSRQGDRFDPVAR